MATAKGKLGDRIGNILVNLAGIFGFDDVADNMLRRFSKAVDKSGNPKKYDQNYYYNELMTLIDNEINKLRGINSDKMVKANTLLNDLAILPNSTAFKGKINQIRRDINSKVSKLDNIDRRITSYDNLMRNQAEQIRDKNVFEENMLVKPVTKEIKDTIQVLKNDIGEKDNV